MTLKSKKLRNSAKGQDCQVRLPGLCNYNPETVVLAHVGKGSGIGQKADDLHAAFCCNACHSVIDSREKAQGLTREQIELYAWHGVQRTQKVWLEMGLIKVAA